MVLTRTGDVPVGAAPTLNDADIGPLLSLKETCRLMSGYSAFWTQLRISGPLNVLVPDFCNVAS